MNRSRVFAKLLDYTLFYSFILLLPISFTTAWMSFLLLPFIFAPFEALSLKVSKGTIGQRIFGICLREKVSLRSAFAYAFKKATLLFPLMIAPINLYFAYKYIKEDEAAQIKRWNLTDTLYFDKTKKHRFLKAFSLVGCILVLLFNYSPQSFKSDIVSITKQEANLKNWVEVKNKDLQFSVFFPKKPKVENKDVEVKQQNTTLNVTEYKHDDHLSYYLQSTVVPSSWTFLGSTYLFKSSAKALEKHQGKIISKKFTKHGKHPCMEYHLNNHKKGQTKGILILAGKKLYKLEIQSKKALSDTELAAGDEFISTFQVNK